MRLLSLATFLVLFTASAFAGGTVGFNLTWYSTPGFPFVDENFPVTTGVVIADFNRDGILDVAYSFPCNSSCAAVILKMGTGGGNLGPDISYQWGASSLAELETADINGDGWLDIVVRDVLDSKLTLLLNSGDGTFQPFSLIFTGGSYLSSFTLGDFNHDGKIDLAEIGCDAPDAGFPFGYANCDLYVYQGDGTGGFTQVQVITLKGPSFNLQSADINGDGNLDLVYVRDGLDGTVAGVVRWGSGDGTFPTATYLSPATTDSLDSVAIADFNNDSQLDLALLSGRACHPTCGGSTPNNVWMYKNLGGNAFSLSSHTQFEAHGGAIVPGDLNGDLNQDLIYFNPYSSGMYPVLQYSPGFDYALGLGKANLGTQGTLANNATESAVAVRDMDGDSRADYATIDWFGSQLGIAIQTGGYKNCPPPSSANLAAAICGIKDGDVVTSPVLVKASGNSPAGVNQMQVWIDGKKQYVKWGDQLSKKFTLSSGSHRIAVVANDKYVGTTKTVINITVQ
jgi:hypothetical protein